MGNANEIVNLLVPIATVLACIIAGFQLLLVIISQRRRRTNIEQALKLHSRLTEAANSPELDSVSKEILREHARVGPLELINEQNKRLKTRNATKVKYPIFSDFIDIGAYALIFFLLLAAVAQAFLDVPDDTWPKWYPAVLNETALTEFRNDTLALVVLLAVLMGFLAFIDTVRRQAGAKQTAEDVTEYHI